jgi:hypothetical protein
MDSAASTPDTRLETPLPDAGMENHGILGEVELPGKGLNREKVKMGVTVAALNVIAPTPYVRVHDARS